jgi:hypothetical protein
MEEEERQRKITKWVLKYFITAPTQLRLPLRLVKFSTAAGIRLENTATPPWKPGHTQTRATSRSGRGTEVRYPRNPEDHPYGDQGDHYSRHSAETRFVV